MIRQTSNVLLAIGIKRSVWSSLLAVGLASCVGAPDREGSDEPGASGVGEDALIYGTDDRLEYGQVIGTEFQYWANSTAAVVSNNQVSCVNGTCTLTTSPWTAIPTGARLCNGVRFRSQPALANCTAFLVGPSLVATAGHCTVLGFPCGSTSLVFDFNADASGANAPTSVPQDNVYRCVAEVANPFQTSSEDWALLQLDRPVPRPVLNVRYDGVIPVGLDLAVLGFPMGIPMKVSPNGEVTANAAPLTFSHNVDTFGGNSGSPVFDALTGMVQGIHVTPPASHWTNSTDVNGPCVVETVCPMTGCPGYSGATRITRAAPQIPLAPVLISHITG